ncbi:hypothetical protein [Ancylobacter pratisalsi]|uniref:Uncharacterized protein n=1 Tax=Ancylobacter pratisalsi TaxID=1745854 RepID=A0A6P1YSE5_9HYPH|nr:hypothetical protein [Ancylobacter pratisalsi]QIB35800.1 hypothetical protein G3A50_20360 [Ancylobacter pratisalsi]
MARTPRDLLMARPFLSPEEVITLAAQLQTTDEAHPDAALIRLQAELRIRHITWMVTMFDDGEGASPPYTDGDALEAANTVANAIRAIPAKTARGLAAHAMALIWDSGELVDLAPNPSDDLDWMPKCFIALMREVERLADVSCEPVVTLMPQA